MGGRESGHQVRFTIHSLCVTFDADHGGNLDSGKSTTEYAVQMSKNIYYPLEQPVVAIVTTEVEYITTFSWA